LVAAAQSDEQFTGEDLVDLNNEVSYMRPAPPDKKSKQKIGNIKI
jgi:hypothetical protein